MNESETIEDESPLDKLVKDLDSGIEKLRQIANENHLDNFNEIVSKCNNNFKCIEKNINLFIDAMNQFTEQIIEENQEKNKPKLDKNR